MKKDIKRIDKLLIILLLIFCIFGLVMIFSASSASTILRYQVESNHFFKKQLEALVVASIVGLIILVFPTKRYKFLSYLGLLGSLFLLIYVLFNGKVSGNARSWIDLGFFSVQPSEFVKTVFIMFMAIYYNGLSKKNNTNLGLYFIPLAISIVFAVLVAYQPDWGSAAIILGISFFTFISVPMVNKNIIKIMKIGIIGIIILAFSLIFFGKNLMTEERMSRFNFTKPCTRYREDTGYQVCNGLIAISNGGLFGVGIGNSSQKYLYLPESHTDFIFPIICEELGAITGFLVIIAYGIFLLRIFRIAKEADNLRTSILAYGAFWYFTLHIVINLLGILALMPLTGVPLPFLSYGGSYCINAVIITFIVERVAIENKKDRLNREIAKIGN